MVGRKTGLTHGKSKTWFPRQYSVWQVFEVKNRDRTPATVLNGIRSTGTYSNR
jgi:hypothetical protein